MHAVVRMKTVLSGSNTCHLSQHSGDAIDYVLTVQQPVTLAASVLVLRKTPPPAATQQTVAPVQTIPTWSTESSSASGPGTGSTTPTNCPLGGAIVAVPLVAEV